MKNKILHLILIITSAFVFSSCGDSKEKIADDTVTLLEQLAEAITIGDEAKIKEIEEKGKKLDERAKALGLDPKAKEFEKGFSDEQKKKYEAAMAKILKAAMNKAGIEK